MKLDGKALAAAMLAKAKPMDPDMPEEVEESMEMDLMKDMMMAIKEDKPEVLYSALCRMIDMHLDRKPD